MLIVFALTKRRLSLNAYKVARRRTTSIALIRSSQSEAKKEEEDKQTYDKRREITRHKTHFESVCTFFPRLSIARRWFPSVRAGFSPPTRQIYKLPDDNATTPVASSCSVKTIRYVNTFVALCRRYFNNGWNINWLMNNVLRESYRSPFVETGSTEQTTKRPLHGMLIEHLVPQEH